MAASRATLTAISRLRRVQEIDARRALESLKGTLDEAFARHRGNLQGQSFTLFIVTVAACEAAVALALLVSLFQRSGSLDVAYWNSLREDNLPAYADEEIPEPPAEPPPDWPHLTPAGVEPEAEELEHRAHV